MKDVKFANVTLALGPGAPQGAVALAEIEQSYKEKYSDYEIKIAEIVSSSQAHIQIFFMFVKQ